MTLALEPPGVLPLLGDPLRWRLLRELARSDLRVGELVERVGRPQNLVSYHLAELRRSGIVGSRRSAHDGRDIYYRVDLGRLRDLLADAAAGVHPGARLAPVPADATRIEGRPRVLFLCTGNSARSQMAEALVVHMSGGKVEARSAGSHPRPLHPDAVRVMAERGIDIAGNEPKPLSRFLRMRFDRVITLCDKVREVCPTWPGGAVESHWSIPDPAAASGSDGDTYPAFVAVADELETRIAFLIHELSDEGRTDA